MKRQQCCTNMKQLPLVLMVEDLIPILGVGRNTAYALVRSGQIKSIRVGKAYRIPRHALYQFLGETA